MRNMMTAAMIGNGSSRIKNHIGDNEYPILNSLLKIGFLTGSVAFGTAAADSDYDICYDISKTGEIEELIPEAVLGDKYESNYNNGWKINERCISINLIPLHPHEYACWYLTTKSMMAIMKELPIISKIRIHSIFGGMVQHFKGVMPISEESGYYDTINEKIFGVPSFNTLVDLSGKKLKGPKTGK
jgi:predicted nucleotidyltransferase